MIAPEDLEFAGTHGRLVVRRWPHPEPRLVVLIAHGYGEHSGRYIHVADVFSSYGAVIYAPDHAGHGRSDGDRANLSVLEDMVTDLRALAALAAADHPWLPVVLVGHSMGGIIATRYVQRYGGKDLVALVLSGPAVGGNPALTMLLEFDPLPNIPIDPTILSRDPHVGQAYAEDPLVYHGPLQRESLQAFVTSARAVAGGGSLAELPTLWIHGEDDQLAPLAVTREAIERIRGPRLQEKVYPGARHEIFNETNSAEVFADILEFLDRTLTDVP